MQKLRPIFKCHGGKYYLADYIIGHFPKNYTELKYIEGCGGAASVLLNKKKSIHEIYNDADTTVAGIVQELAAEDSGDFIEEIRQISYDEETFNWAKKVSEDNSPDQSLAELVRRRFSRGGLRQAFAWSNRLRGGQPGDVNAWETYKEQIPKIAERLRGVEVYALPIIELISMFDSEDVLWYIDPPYLPSSRQATKTYTVEMTEEDHVELALLLNAAKGKVVLSGYQSSLYTKLYKNWNMSCRPMKNHAGQGEKKQTRIECVWINY